MCDFSSCLFDVAMKPLEALRLTERRRQLLSSASGRVLEVGAGTGANLPYFRYEHIADLTLTDAEVRARLQHRVRWTAEAAGLHPARLSVCEAPAEQLPFEDASFDCVVATLVFCTVADQQAGLTEVRRVLKPGGALLFMEHVRPPRAVPAKLFAVLNPAWRLVSGGCNLTRETLAALRQVGLPPRLYGTFGGGIFTYGIAPKAA